MSVTKSVIEITLSIRPPTNAAVKYPSVSADSQRTWLTRQRTDALRKLLPDLNSIRLKYRPMRHLQACSSGLSTTRDLVASVPDGVELFSFCAE